MQQSQSTIRRPAREVAYIPYLFQIFDAAAFPGACLIYGAAQTGHVEIKTKTQQNVWDASEQPS